MMQDAMKQPVQKAALSVAEFCEAAGISKANFYNQVKAGRIQIRKCGSRTLIPVSELSAWLESLPTAGA